MTVILAAMTLLAAGEADPNEGEMIQSETGFKGAVTVVEDTEDEGYRVVVVKVPYLDVQGERREGLARLVVEADALKSGKRLPAFCHVHYEKDVGGAKKWAERGWAVTTAHYTKEYPGDPAVGNCNNQARAIIQWVRRLPFIDRTRLHLDGGSQGGYAALAMSAEFFPVTSTTSSCPVVNWAYLLNYFEMNKPISGYPDKHAESPTPVLGMVTSLADQCYTFYGEDLSADAWYYVSPIAYVDRVTSPVLLTAATGDMLVPMEQMTRDIRHPFNPERFPEGYQRDFDTLTLNTKARKRFEELLPEGQVFIHYEPLQENSYEFTWERFQDPEKRPAEGPKELDRTWSKDHQWSLFYMDEGPPLPEAPHTSYFWNTDMSSFVDHYRDAAPSPDLLNAAKLDRLMQRYRLQLKDLPMLKEGRPANRLNFAALERRDVLQGLVDFAALGPAHATELAETYNALDAKPFGDTLDIGALEAELARTIANTSGQQGE